jgi:general stress protein CsbA
MPSRQMWLHVAEIIVTNIILLKNQARKGYFPKFYLTCYFQYFCVESMIFALTIFILTCIIYIYNICLWTRSRECLNSYNHLDFCCIILDLNFYKRNITQQFVLLLFKIHDYTITLWFPCLDGLIQIRGNIVRVKKSARKHEPKASDFARFS